MSAAHARIAMTTERSGTAASDRIEYLALRPGRRSDYTVAGSCHRDANDVGHLEGRPAHRFLSCCSVRKRDLLQRVDGGMEVTPRELEIDGCVLEPLMAHQQLNRAQVGAGFEQVRRIAVP